jgi:hypothetical protein
MRCNGVSPFKVGGAFAALAWASAVLPVQAQVGVPNPCDFITSGGFVVKESGGRANFGAHGGCKNGDFWGHVNYVDHDLNYHVSSLEVTGYLFDAGFPRARDICGVARTNDEEIVRFRVRLIDEGKNDFFGIRLSNGYLVTTRRVSGGNVELHRENPSTTPGPDGTEDALCAGLAPPIQEF